MDEGGQIAGVEPSDLGRSPKCGWPASRVIYVEHAGLYGLAHLVSHPIRSGLHNGELWESVSDLA
jgi:hypothetical protein